MRSRKGGQPCALRCRQPHLWQRMCYEVMSYHALAKGRAAVRAAVPQTAFVAGDERVRGRTPDDVVALALGKHGEHFVRCGASRSVSVDTKRAEKCRCVRAGAAALHWLLTNRIRCGFEQGLSVGIATLVMTVRLMYKCIFFSWLACCHFLCLRPYRVAHITHIAFDSHGSSSCDPRCCSSSRRCLLSGPSPRDQVLLRAGERVCALALLPTDIRLPPA